jgi:dihydropyrimidine dehydrogenase (NADP+)
MGINLDTLRPEPCVEGYSTPGGYSYRAVKPIALEKVMSISRLLQQQGFREQGASLSGIGGVETGGDAAEFILLGCDTVQVRALRRARHIRRGGVAAAALLASWADAVVLNTSLE